MDRRAFVIGSLGGMASALQAAAPAPAGVIDTHTHFYDPTRQGGVPWPPASDRMLYRRVLPPHFKAVAGPLGVAGTVVVEASPRVEDNQWLLDLARDQPVIVGVVGRLTSGDAAFARHLARFARNPLFRGIRVGSDEARRALAEPRRLDDLRRLADHGLALDVIGGPESPADVARLAERLPGLRMVINHVANVAIDGRAPPAGWLSALRAAASRPNVYCKVSGLVEGTGRADGKAPRDVRFYRPVLDAVWQAFGADRLVYGSNWPVSERFAPYGVVLGIVRDYFTAKGTDVADKVFRRNATAAYKLPKR